MASFRLSRTFRRAPLGVGGFRAFALLRGECGAMRGDAGELGTSAASALHCGTLRHSRSNLEVLRLRLGLGLLCTQLVPAGPSLRIAMRAPRGGLSAFGGKGAFINAERVHPFRASDRAHESA